MTWINKTLNLFFNFIPSSNPRRAEGSKVEVLFPSVEVLTPDYAAAIELELYEQITMVKATLTGNLALTAVIDAALTANAEVILILTADGQDCVVTPGTGFSGDAITVPDASTVKALFKYDGTSFVQITSSNDTVQDGAITAAKLASNAVETAKIKDKNVTLAKLEDGTAGDLLVFTTATGWTKLAKGTDGQILKMVTGAPAWANA